MKLSGQTGFPSQRPCARLAMIATSVSPPSRARLLPATLLLPLALLLGGCSQPSTDDASVAADAAAAAGEVIVVARFKEDDARKLHVGQRAVVHLTNIEMSNDRMGRSYESESKGGGFEGRLKAFGEPPSAAGAQSSVQAGSFVNVVQRKPVQIAVAVPAEARALFLPMRKAVVEMKGD